MGFISAWDWLRAKRPLSLCKPSDSMKVSPGTLVNPLKSSLTICLPPVAFALLVGCGGGSATNQTGAAPKPAGPVLTLTLQDAAWNPPAFVAAQDGDGLWKAVQGSAGVYTFQVSDPGGRYGVCIGYLPAVGSPNIALCQGTLAELPSLTFKSQDKGGSASANGSVSALSNAELGYVTLAGQTAAVQSWGSPAFALHGLAEGPCDLVVADLQANGLNGMGPATKMLIERGTQVSATTDLGVLDLGASGFTTQIQTISVSGMSSPEAEMDSFFNTAGRIAAGQRDTFMGMQMLTSDSRGASTVAFPSVPVAHMQDGDMHSVAITCQGQNGRQSVEADFAAPRDLALVLPPEIPAPQMVQVTGSSSPRVQLQWTPLHAAQSHVVVLQDGCVWTVMLTAGWTGTGATLTYAQPDLSQVQGWASAFAFRAGDSLHGFVESVIASRPGVFFNPLGFNRIGGMADGGVLQNSTSNSQSITLK